MMGSRYRVLAVLATLAASIPYATAETRGNGHICTPDHCREGGTSALVGAHSSTPSIFLLPGVYTSTSPLAALIDQTAGYLTNPLGNLNPLNGSSSVWLGSTTEKGPDDIGSSALPWPLVVSSPFTPIAFSNYVFSGKSTSLDNSTHLTLPSQWESLYLPASTWARIDTESGQWVVRDGGIAKRPALPGGGRAASGSRAVSFGSDRCSTSCGIGGTCLPSTSVNSTTTATYACSCFPGFTGPTCSSCQPNHYGPSCVPCAGAGTGCGACDDGVEGSGGCVSVQDAANCGCAHGSCVNDSTCVCAAGWTTNTSDPLKCSRCLDGYYESSSSCLACPLGSHTCSSATASLTCIAGWGIGPSGMCEPFGAAASCGQGQYWTGTGCASCSPACQTCSGPGAGDCLRCSSPRATLLGNCVGYDASTGVCDKSSTQLHGAFFHDNVKGECDACPAGCLTCSIPNFSVTSSRSDVVCSACQDGYVLDQGKCTRTCGVGRFLPTGSGANATCLECDLSVCESCISTSTTCLSCAGPSTLATPIGSCVTACPGGTYLPSSVSRSCVPCPGDCATCSSTTTGANSSAQCLSCPSTRPVLRNGRCEEVCPSGQYWNAATSSCGGCSVGCISCIGPSATECLSCTSGSVLKAGACQTAGCASDGWVDSLGVCLVALINTGGTGGTPTWWPYVLAVGLVGVAAGTIFAWWIRRERRRTQERTREFGDALDDAEVGKKLNVLRLGRLGRSKNLGHPPSPTDSPRSARFFTFLSVRSPPASPLSDGSLKGSSSPSPRRAGKLKSLQLAAADRESFFSSGAQPPPAYSPTDDTSFAALDAKTKDVQRRLSVIQQGGPSDRPDLLAPPTPRRTSKLKWADLQSPSPAVSAPDRGFRPLVDRAGSDDVLDKMEETVETFTRHRSSQGLGRVLQRTLTGSVSALKKPGMADNDSSWLFEPPPPMLANNARAARTMEPRERSGSEDGMQGLLDVLNEGPADGGRVDNTNPFVRRI